MIEKDIGVGEGTSEVSKKQKSLELLSCNTTKLPLPSAAAGLSARKSQESRSKLMPLKQAATTV